MAVIDEEMVYILQKAGDRLQQMANNCRGTVCDDHKVYGLQKEADAIRQAVNIFVRQMPPSRLSKYDVIEK